MHSDALGDTPKGWEEKKIEVNNGKEDSSGAGDHTGLELLSKGK